MRHFFFGVALVAALSALASPALAAVATVGAFGDEGWKSDDTRNAAGVNLVGINNTHAPRPGQVPTAADDAAIAGQIKFVDGPAGSTFGGAVSIDGTPASAGKSNFSVINTTTGFAPASVLTTPDFFVEYEMYKQNLGSGSTLAFKIGIQSTAWGIGPGQSQNGFVAQRSGESVWDLVLVHVPTVTSNVWTTVNLDHDTGAWTLFRQAGNTFHPAPPANPFAQTLDAWALDPTWGPLLFGAGAQVSSIQFGLGSGQPNGFAYVDYLQTNLLNGGDVINFIAPVPEPASLAIWGTLSAIGMTGTFLRRRRQPTDAV